MKLIFKIARAEVRNLFYSPVAWFLAIAFLIQCAFFYSSAIANIAKWQDMMVDNVPDFKGLPDSLTQMIFLVSDGIFSNVIGNLYLFLPLLTMGLISREISNGTVKLLYSSPIKIRHIVLGKYLAIMLYSLLLLAIVGIFIIAGLFNIVHVDTGILLSALLGFYLLVCAYSAIGIFMSSLTTYQIVSAVATFLILFVLSRIGGLWQQYDFVRDLTYFLSMNGRTGKMLSGLITTNDIVYFFLVIFMFLSFTLFRIKGSMESKPWPRKALQYLGVMVLVLTIGYITSRPGYIGYWDTTRNNTNTIHPNTQEVIKDFEPGEPLEVTLYANLLHQSYIRGGAPQTRNNYKWNLWEKYLRFKPDIKFKYVFYYDAKDGDSTLYKRFPNKSLEEIAQMMAKRFGISLSRFLSPIEIRQKIDLEIENLRLVMQLKYKGRTTFLRTFDDSEFWPNEMNVSAAFKRLQQAQMPKVLYTTGDLERSIYKTGEREYYSHTINKENRKSLINLGFDIDTVNLNRDELPDNISVLVVADPKTELSIEKQAKISRFVARGGNVFYLGEPGKQQMLNPLLRDLGVRLSPGTLVEVTKDEMPHMVIPSFTEEALILSDQYVHQREALKNDGAKVSKIMMLMPGVTEVKYLNTDDGFKRFPILSTQTARNTFNKVGKLVIDSLPPIYKPQEGDTRKETFATLVALSRKIQKKEQYLLVSGDADFMSTLRAGGGAFTIALYSWLTNNRFPIYTPMERPIDVLLAISSGTAKIQYYVFVWILPVLLLLAGTVILIRRKRK